ncbi:hypothetical protein KCH_30080 [Kitasatospora cheerisanensis KCTC 2395]|uniref:Uncharacterized protein n=1 Tax=Kitasatospora cheerisanensis KCTC 2395 TaxID=1348663 RepID=A0A066YZ03_9ACTN|nr:hypothetical protein KCH_30080 [Kitasatospora cheerisanensis KCTC 2395]
MRAGVNEPVGAGGCGQAQQEREHRQPGQGAQVRGAARATVFLFIAFSCRPWGCSGSFR